MAHRGKPVICAKEIAAGGGGGESATAHSQINLIDDELRFVAR